MNHLPAWVRLILDRRFLYGLAWILALGIGAGRFINARYGFANAARPDGNNGHVTIDFGGQWMLGRMLATGHGRELYVRPRLYEVAQRAYPRHHESPEPEYHDAEGLVYSFMGDDDPRWKGVGGAFGALVGPSGAFFQAGVALQAEEYWSPALWYELNHPTGKPGIGGPLYPPTHAFVMLPFALDDHPQAAYYVMQLVQTLLCFVAGLGVSFLSRGRFWWPLASAILLVFPGCRGAVDLGQNSPLSVAILIWGWVAMARGRPTLGGLVWALLAFKPVWALSFFILLLLIRQWRAALVMALAGAALVAATLPFVGVDSWRYWIFTGQIAAKTYNLDANWIPLSRDMLTMPRRILVDFTMPRAERDHPLILAACWALWGFIIEITLRVYSLNGRRPIPFTGPLPAMLLLTAWMCTFHFMYYDAMLSAFGVMVLLADPRPFFRRRVLKMEEPTARRRSEWLVNSFVLTVLGLLIAHECVTRPMKWEATAAPTALAVTRTFHDGSTELSPTFVVGSNDRYPVDVFLIVLIWIWCCGAVLAGKDDQTPDCEREGES